jgi:glucosamine--fructose-6-phosphate aminotransferase (isomerizing)
VPIHAGPETTVSTKTYINTLATNLLIAECLLGNDTRKVKEEMLVAADAMQSYLEEWKDHASTLNALLGDFRNMIVVGRGASMSAVWNGSLINKEAAKFQLEGMHAAEFRHGPLELVSSGFTALVLAGPSGTAHLNRNLAMEIKKRGGRAIWIDSHIDAELPTIVIPDTDDLVRPLVEILPLQMLTLVMAERNHVTAGQFRHVTKVTSIE